VCFKNKINFFEDKMEYFKYRCGYLWLKGKNMDMWMKQTIYLIFVHSGAITCTSRIKKIKNPHETKKQQQKATPSESSGFLCIHFTVLFYLLSSADTPPHACTRFCRMLLF